MTKRTKAKAQKASTNNGAQASKRPRREKQLVPELPEKLKKLTLKAFRKTYEAHHGKSS
jgi:hypothetical protein